MKELNAEKMRDEKHYKTREKKVNKKIKALEEEKCRFKIEQKINVEHECNNNVLKVTKTSQTEKHVDIPYKISSPLPPIFSYLEEAGDFLSQHYQADVQVEDGAGPGQED